MSDPNRIELSPLDLMPSWVSNLEKSLHTGFEEYSEREEGDKRGRDRRSGGEKPREFGERDRNRGGGGAGAPNREGERRGGFGDRDRGRREGGDRGRGGGAGGRDGDRKREGGNRESRGGRFGSGERREGSGGGRFGGGEEHRPPTGVSVSIEPSSESVAALTRHIRGTGRTYALADLAKMILQGRERYQLRFRSESAVEKPLYFCPADESLWLARDEALAHVLRGPALSRYYRIEDVTVDPPKGNFSVIAVCGLSGTVLGPPNHHDYTIKVVRLYKERFSDMSFERYKSRIEMRRDEETIEKWKTEVSVQRQYRPRANPLAPGEVDPDEVKPADPAAEPIEELPTATEELPSDETSAPDTPESSPSETEKEPEPNAESATEPEGETATEPEGEAAAAAETVGEVIKSSEALERHFKQHFAEGAARSVGEAVVSGNIPGKRLSPGLLNLVRNEADRQRKSFPLTMIQHLCREFESVGLRFFKRGKKALHVSVTRPRAIEDEEALSERIREIIRFVRAHPRKKVVDLLDALVSDYQRPAEGETFEQHHLTEKEHAVLADLRWLTMEGYLLEFPGTELVLGKMDPPAPAAKPDKSAAPAPAAETLPEPELAPEAESPPEPELEQECEPEPIIAESETAPVIEEPASDEPAAAASSEESDPAGS